MKWKTKLRVIQILCIVSLLITVFSVQRTYAKYYEKVGTNYQSNIKKWLIKVDGQKIHELGKNELTQVMTPEFRPNVHMNNNNTLVPGREGFFEFVVDYSKVDVAFRFEFDIEQLNKKTITEGEGASQTTTEVDAHLEDFEIYGYSIVTTDQSTGTQTETKTLLATANDMAGLTQVIDPTLASDTTKTKTIRILFRWNDENADTTQTDDKPGMNNHEDTVFAGEANASDTMRNLLKYKVKVTFTQQV